MRNAAREFFDLCAHYDYSGANKAVARLSRMVLVSHLPTNTSSGSLASGGTNVAHHIGEIPGGQHSIISESIPPPGISGLAQLLLVLIKLEPMYAALELSRPRRVFGREV
jgi:hypothetical protein